VIESSDEHEKSNPSSLSQKVIFYVHRPWISSQCCPLSTRERAKHASLRATTDL